MDENAEAVSAKPKMVHVHFYIPEELKQAYVEIAGDLRRSTNQTVTMALENMLPHHGFSKKTYKRVTQKAE